MELNTTTKGELACLKVEMRAYEKGAIVSKPGIECDYDRVVDYDGKLHKIQVKWADTKSNTAQGVVIAKLERGNRNNNRRAYSRDDVDAVVVYAPKTDKVYWFGPDVFDNKWQLQMRLKPTKNGQTKGCLMAADYEW
jgi:hypothetical protein